MEHKVHPKIIELLKQNGIENVKCFLYPDFSCYHDSTLLPDIREATTRIKSALKNKEKVLIWGHDDLDGISSAALAKEGLLNLGIKEVSVYIPKKTEERYRISLDKIKEFVEKGVSLVITVDTGSSIIKEGLKAKELGIDVIITDHHEVTGFPKSVVAFINPKRPDSSYPFRELAGVGVVLKFILFLYEELVGLSKKEFLSLKPEFLGFAGLGTIADRMPLVDENRVIVKDSLYIFSWSDFIPFKIWREEAEIKCPVTVKEIFQKGIQFFYSAEPTEGVELLTNQDPIKLRNMYKLYKEKIKEWNIKREEMLRYAEEKVVIYGSLVISIEPNISVDFLGTCAGRLKDKYSLPAFVITKKGDQWIGEVRSPEGIDALEILKKFSDLFTDFGGHKFACGFSINEANLHYFIPRFEELAETLEMEDTERKEKQEMVLSLSEFPDEMKYLLPPYGPGNPSPIFLSPNTEVKFSRGKYEAGGKEIRFKYPPSKDHFNAHLTYTLEDSGEIVVIHYREV